MTLETKLMLGVMVAFVLITVGVALYKRYARKKLDTATIEAFNQQLEVFNQEVQEHQATAASARQEVVIHEKKAEVLSHTPAPAAKTSMSDAISAWNDDII
jgi:uncharacterized membrane-anchored protein YhcB (DUF1043 family)